MARSPSVVLSRISRHLTSFPPSTFHLLRIIPSLLNSCNKKATTDQCSIDLNETHLLYLFLFSIGFISQSFFAVKSPTGFLVETLVSLVYTMTSSSMARRKWKTQKDHSTKHWCGRSQLLFIFSPAFYLYHRQKKYFFLSTSMSEQDIDVGH